MAHNKAILSALGQQVIYSSPVNYDFAVVQTQDIATSREIVLVVEATADNGETWFVFPVTAVGKGMHVTNIWSNGRWLVDTGPFNAIRVRVTEYTAGFVTVHCSPGEVITHPDLILDKLEAMAIRVSGQVNVTDPAKQRLEEKLLLEAYASRTPDSRYGNEVR